MLTFDQIEVYFQGYIFLAYAGNGGLRGCCPRNPPFPLSAKRCEPQNNFLPLSNTMKKLNFIRKKEQI